MNRIFLVGPLLSLFLGQVAHGEVELKQLPPMDEALLSQMPKNLARWHMEAELIILDQSGRMTTMSVDHSSVLPEAVLLSDDETLTYRMTRGSHSFIVDLGEFYPINRSFFLNYEGQGSVSIAVSETLSPIKSRRWRRVVESADVSPSAPHNFIFPVTTGKYVLFEFDAETSTEIGYLGVYGETSIAETEFESKGALAVEAKGEAVATGGATIPYDFASLYTGCSISHVSSGDLISANFMIDDDYLTSYEFSSEDDETVLALDLRRSAKLNGVSMLFAAGSGTLEIYLLPEVPVELREREEQPLAGGLRPGLPQSANQPGAPYKVIKVEGAEEELQTVPLGERFFEDRAPTATKVKEGEVGMVRYRSEFKASFGRVLLIRWIPEKANQPTLKQSSTALHDGAREMMPVSASPPQEPNVEEKSAAADPDLSDLIARVQALGGHFFQPPGSGGLRVFEISLFGDLPFDQAVLDRILQFQFADTTAGGESLLETTTIDTAPQIAPTSP